MKMKKDTKIFYFIYFGIAFFYCISNFIWYKINSPILVLGGDFAEHFFDIFRPYHSHNAPLIPFLMKGLFFVFGTEYFDFIIIALNFIFFMSTTFFIYKITEFIKDKQAGYISMIIFSLVPLVFIMLRFYGRNDFHLMLFVTASIYFLLKTNFYNNLKESIMCGVFIGLSLMTKDAALAFLFFPVLYVVVKSLFLCNIKKRLINISIMLVIIFLICAYHYMRIDIILKILSEPICTVVNPFDFIYFRTFSIGLYEEILSPPIFVFIVLGSIIFLLKFKNEYKDIIVMWFLIPWITLMFLSFKIVYFGMSFIPALVIMGSIGFSIIDKNRIKKIFFLIIFIISIIQYVIFSFPLCEKIFDNLYIKFHNKTFQYFSYKNIFFYFNITVRDAFLSMIQYLKTVDIPDNEKIILVSGSSRSHFARNEMFYLVKIYKLKNVKVYQWINDVELDDFSNTNIITCGIFSRKEEFDFLVMKKRDHPIVNRDLQLDINSLNRKFEILENNFKIVEDFYLIDDEKEKNYFVKQIENDYNKLYDDNKLKEHFHVKHYKSIKTL